MAWARGGLVVMPRKENLGRIGGDFNIVHKAFLLLTGFGSSLNFSVNLRMMRNNKESNKVRIKMVTKN